ncbi:MFS general substrate transporter [Auriculariales sp. MPI-PUGE-AT-0066]|nr:MFS general substrate transporter [Auriculariales sp. MPI-PUGE-AT-0066]
MIVGPMDPERQPLLARKETPLPMLQLTIICLVRLAEPLTFTQIFPYINRMVELMHITDNPADVGWYSGMIDSVFAVAQLTMIFSWAKMSDRIGRKPCVLVSITGAATATLLFGLSKNLYMAVAARIMAGLMAGNVAVIESMVGELTDETNQARAFVLVDLVWYSGSIFGTLLGGCLSEPATRLPSVFGESKILAEFPFLLPSLVAYILAMVSVLIGFIWMKETLPRKQRQADNGSVKTAADVAPEPTCVSAWTLLTDPIVQSVLAPYLLLSIQCIGFEVIFTLFSYTSISLGGLGRSPFEIGIAMAFAGVACGCVPPDRLPMARESRRIEEALLQLDASLPDLLLLHTTAQYRLAGDVRAGRIVVWVLVGLVLLVVRTGGMAFAAHTIFVKHASPTPDALGSTFGILHTVGATGRAIGPVLVSSLFALTASRKLLGGWFVWLFMVGVGIAALFLSERVRDGSKERITYIRPKVAHNVSELSLNT